MARRHSSIVLGVLSIGLILTAASIADAAVSFTADGVAPLDNTNVSAQVDFIISGNQLKVILTNTSTAGTNSNGSVLTGVTWDFEPDLAGSLTITIADNPHLSPGSNIYEEVPGTNGNNREVRINNAISLGGSWTNNLTDPSLGDFGVSTTGGDGIFGVAGIVGNGGADYGIVGPNTYPIGPGDFLIGNNGPQQLPLVQNAVYFEFQFTGTLTEDMIAGVNFLFGTAGDYIPGEEQPPQGELPEPAPEPMTLAIWAGLGGLGLLASRRRLKVAG